MLHLRKAKLKLTQLQGFQPKYFLWALGELFLLVIGILIAIQVDNWKDEQLLIQKEYTLLANLNTELSGQQYEITATQIDLKKNIVNIELILDKMGDDDHPLTQLKIDSLIAQTMPVTIWITNSFILDELKNAGGISNLRDEKLINDLFQYTGDFQVLARVQNEFDYHSKLYLEYLTQTGSLRDIYSNSNSGLSVAKSKLKRNSVDVLNDPVFENYLTNYYIVSKRFLDYLKVINDETSKIIQKTNPYSNI